MTRSQTLGIMAAAMAGRVNVVMNGVEDTRERAVEDIVALADALLREAEKVSPELPVSGSECAGWGGQGYTECGPTSPAP